MAERIKIVSDGTPGGTKVMLPNGERHPGIITKLEWSIEAGTSIGIAKLTLIGCAIEVDANLDLPAFSNRISAAEVESFRHALVPGVLKAISKSGDPE